MKKEKNNHCLFELYSAYSISVWFYQPCDGGHWLQSDSLSKYILAESFWVNILVCVEHDFCMWNNHMYSYLDFP